MIGPLRQLEHLAGRVAALSVAVLCIEGAVKQNVKPATTFRQTLFEKSTTVFAFDGLLLKEGKVGAP